MERTWAVPSGSVQKNRTPRNERGREYDAVPGAYAEWVEREGLPLVEQHFGATKSYRPIPV
jgi:hypothetical protein